MGDIKAVLFDFWGTLAENGTYSPLKQTYSLLRVRKPFGEFVQAFEEAFMTKVFDSQEVAFTTALEALGITVRKEVVDQLIGLWNKNRLLARFYPETQTVLQDLKKDFKIALISNTDCFVTSVFDKFHLLSFFDATALSFEEGYLKTDPRLFAVALEKLGCAADEAIMVGDSLETDIVGAERAGVKAILVDRSGKRQYEWRVQNLRELRQMIAHV